jgi:hypothetical protein
MRANIGFDRHARQRMKWRGISEGEVFVVIEDPDKTEDAERGRTNVYKRIGGRVVKVTYKQTPGETLIISASGEPGGGRR